VDATFTQAASRRALLWLAAFKIVLVVLIFDPRGNVAFDLPKSIASRATEWAIGALVVFVLIVYGRGVVPRTRLHVAAAALAGVSAVAGLFAAEPYIAIFGEQDRYLGLTFLADMLVLYLAVSIAVRTARDVAVLLGAIGTAGVVAGGYALVQALGADPFTWAVDAQDRPFATFGNPDQFGHFISVVFGVTFGAAIGASRARRRAIFGASALATLAIAALVATRGTLVGIGGALACAAAIQRPTRRVALAGTAATIAIAAVLLVTPLGQRALATVQGGPLGAVTDRIALYRIAASATLTRPWLGYGPDNFRAAFVAHRTAESLAILTADPQTSAHNWLFDSSATTGLIGLAALVALVVTGTVELAGVAREKPVAGLPVLVGWSAYWANALVDVGSVGVAWFPWLALGIAAALRGTHPDVTARRVPRWLGPVVAALAIAGMATGARLVVANEEAWSAVEASHFGDPGAALAFADRAAARDGGRADNWNRLGLAYGSLRRWGEAADAYRAAASRERYEPVYWTNLGRALTRVALGGKVGADDDAVASAREAIEVDPNSPLGHVALAEIAVALGRCELARSEAAQAAALEPGHSDLVTRAAACHSA
jgi:O-antigen ligase